MDCFNGDYPAGLYDYEEDFNNSLTDIQGRILERKNK